MANATSLFNPRSAAIVGDTPGPGRGGWLHEQLVRFGYQGAIYPVNPKYDEIRGLPAYPSVADIPEAVEFAAVALGAQHAPRVMQECADAGVKAVLFIASGFAEAGDEGLQLQTEIAEIADRHGMAVCGPNCYGIANIRDGFVAYAGPLAEPMEAGPISLVYQSGALTHGSIDPAVLRGLGYGHIITTGNEAVTELADYVDVIAEDPNTRVIACFVEGFKNPRAFAAAVRKAHSRGKRVVVLKVGRSELAKAATLAHTGSLAGEDRMYDALFRSLGIVRVHDLDELIEAVTFLSIHQSLVPGNIAIASISGGSCGVIADLAEDVGLSLNSFGDATNESLQDILPAFATVNNPLDLTGAVAENPGMMTDALSVLAADPKISAVGFALNTPLGTESIGRELYRKMAADVAAVAEKSSTPVFLFTMSSGGFDSEVLANAKSIPVMQGMRETVKVLQAVQQPWDRSEFPERKALSPQAGQGMSTVNELLSERDDGPMTEREAKGLLQALGINIPRERLARSPEDAVEHLHYVGLPAALKVESADISHKSDVGGVLLGLESEEAVAAGYQKIIERVSRQVPGAKVEGITVAQMAQSGLDMIVGVSNPVDIGPAIILGLGGVYVEILDDIVMEMAPFDRSVATDMVWRLRGADLLAGARGSAPGDVNRLVDVLVTMSNFAWQFRDRLAEVDINPLRVLPDGEGVTALDALVVLRSRKH